MNDMPPINSERVIAAIRALPFQPWPGAVNHAVRVARDLCALDDDDLSDQQIEAMESAIGVMHDYVVIQLERWKNYDPQLPN